jgi:hypothetical protein
VRYLKFNGVLEEVLDRYPDIDLVRFLEQKLQIPDYKAKELAVRIEKDYCGEILGKVKQNLEKPIILDEPKKLKLSSKVNVWAVESLSGKEFERFLKWLFGELGFEVHPGKYFADSGVDLVASKNGEKIVIQARQYPKSMKASNSVILKAQEAIGVYGCKRSIVVATSYFTYRAVLDAQKLGIELWDIDALRLKIDKVKKAAEVDGQSCFPKYKGSLLQSLLSLEETKDFMIERRANGKYDLHLPGVKFPLLSFQARFDSVIRCVYRIKNNVPVGEFDGLSLIKSDRNNRYGPDGERAYALIIKYLEEFVE